MSLELMPPKSGATISACGTYRYQLWRDFRTHIDQPWMTFVMLNPSTADAEQDDPTIRRCIGFAKREGCGGIVVLNLFAFRATDPADLVAAHKAGVDVVGPSNGWTHRLDLRHRSAIAAWGAHPLAPVGIHALRRDWIGAQGMRCLGTTKSGAPRHPLYVKADQPLEVWP